MGLLIWWEEVTTPHWLTTHYCCARAYLVKRNTTHTLTGRAILFKAGPLIDCLSLNNAQQTIPVSPSPQEELKHVTMFMAKTTYINMLYKLSPEKWRPKVVLIFVMLLLSMKTTSCFRQSTTWKCWEAHPGNPLMLYVWLHVHMKYKYQGNVIRLHGVDRWYTHCLSKKKGCIWKIQ